MCLILVRRNFLNDDFHLHYFPPVHHLPALLIRGYESNLLKIHGDKIFKKFLFFFIQVTQQKYILPYASFWKIKPTIPSASIRKTEN